jgi:protein gp37
MFPFINCPTWNPVTGCRHACTYCWARKLAETKLKHTKRYAQGFTTPTLNPEELNRKFKDDDFVFVSDMGDLFCESIPDEWYAEVFCVIRAYMKTQFLLMTKNPHRYYGLGFRLPQNVVLGATIESNRVYLELSRAPDQRERIAAMQHLSCDYVAQAGLKRFIAIEPILDFDLDEFLDKILSIKPWAVAVGYDNYNNHLPKPPLAKTLQLIEGLEAADITVYRKTLREAAS